MKPVFLGPGELSAGKADASSEYKLSKPGTYNITVAPGSPMSAAPEFGQQKALLIGWTGSFPAVVAAIVKAADPVADIWVVHYGSSAKTDFQSQMALYGASTTGLQYINTPLDSIWIRDYGPMSLQDADTGKVLLLDARYFHERFYDDAVPKKFGDTAGLQSFRMPVKFEGGNFMTDGRGTCVVSQGVLWYNSVSQATLEQYFREYMGCWQLVILNPLDGEGTTHIDMFTKLADEDTVVLGEYKSTQDPTNKALMDENEGIYGGVVLAGGGTLEVVRMPMPSNADGNFRTYVNSQFINGVNLVPVYTNDKTYESQAMTIWQQVLPTWSHVKIDATELITWSGAVHCILMEVAEGDWSANQTGPAELCSTYSCYPTSGQGNLGCQPTTVLGGCQSGTASWCDFGELQATTCGDGEACGYQWSEAHYGCAAGQGCTPSCAGKACGNDGCAGSCGTCATGFLCQANQCVADASSCGGIPYEGCCAGKALKFCEQGSLKTWNCQDSCGWAVAGYYDCAASGSDPSGEFPIACPGAACTPSCQGAGPLGPSFECGDDGCGGSCGTCNANQQCQGGACVALPATGCGDTSWEGLCDGGKVTWCEAEQLNSEKCQSGCCGWAPNASYYGCYPSDACGTCYNECTAGSQGCSQESTHAWACQAATDDYPCTTRGWVACPSGCDPTTGACKTDCTPSCQGAAPLGPSFECGSDGCGGSCGTCLGAETCSDGLCVAGPCAPKCAGKQCGSNGCGGSCGECASGQTCGADGTCAAAPTPCGEMPEEGICGGEVLTWCKAGAIGTTDCKAIGKTCGLLEGKYTCVAPEGCLPACGGKACGPDGCGGACGSCPAGQVCGDGLCVAASTCGEVTFEGVCEGNLTKWCENGTLQSYDCTIQGRVCGFKLGAGYTCIDGGACAPQCAGKACGDDGCGGACGTCGLGFICEGSQCVEEPTRRGDPGTEPDATSPPADTTAPGDLAANPANDDLGARVPLAPSQPATRGCEAGGEAGAGQRTLAFFTLGLVAALGLGRRRLTAR
jgi:agmatine/peptidylarginine deiminase